MTEVKIKQKPETPVRTFVKRLMFFVVVSPFFLICGWMMVVMSYILVADAWGASLEAEPYPNGFIVHEYGRSNSTYDFVWYCTSDSIDLVFAFYEEHNVTAVEYKFREHHYSAYQIIDNSLTRLFTSIGTGWTDSSPDASLEFWTVTDHSTEFEQEKCKDGVLIEIGSGYAE